jgi:hypothetical protein
MSSRHLLIVAVVGLFSTAQAGTIYVDDDNCPGPGDGSALDPYCSIQTAIDNADDTDEIVVAPGIYLETINFLGKAVMLRSSDGPQVTIIAAQWNGSVVTCDSGEGPDTVLEGFTITGGSGTDVYLVPRGGGMYIENSSPTVANCVFWGNVAWRWCWWPLPGYECGDGGGMYITEGTPTVTDCTFVDNEAGWGGGGMYNLSSSPTVTDCKFLDNYTYWWGGGGGGMFNANSNPTVTDCKFLDNYTEWGGGGGMANHGSSPTVTDCRFERNTGYGYGGGGMYNANGTPTITDSLYCENTPDDISGDWDGDDITFCPVCDGHVDNDGVVNTGDLLELLAAWGSCPAPPAYCVADFDESGEVGVTDFLAMLANWGPCH